MPTPDRYREDDEPEPDYERPTRAEAEAEARDYEKGDRCPTCAAPFAGPVRSDNCPVPEQHRGGRPVTLATSTDRQLAARLRAAADRVGTKRPDLAALLQEAASRLAEEEPF